jgi:hypothetical protein
MTASAGMGLELVDTVEVFMLDGDDGTLNKPSEPRLEDEE